MKPLFIVMLIISFVGSSLYIPQASADELNLPYMPQPGVRVSLSPDFIPAQLKGITIHPENPFMFDFIIQRGDKLFSYQQKKEEYKKLIKYFLASLAIPDEDQWVNLSPYEKNRIIKDDFGKTLMGRDLLSQDYILKQITASLIYPEDNLGKKFWSKIYAKAQEQYGTTNIPVNTFNKVWIIPDSALIYEKGNTAYVLKNHLKVMLEEDYLSLQKHAAITNKLVILSVAKDLNRINSLRDSSASPQNDMHALGSQIIRELILPALEKEVNEGKNFASLRQVFSGMILAAWFKRTLKKSILGQIYADRTRVKGVDQDPKNNEAIYQRYLRAYKKGVFNYIKEDVDKYTNETIPRKYFSGGLKDTYNTDHALLTTREINPDQLTELRENVSVADLAQVVLDRAMFTEANVKAELNTLLQEFKKKPKVSFWVEDSGVMTVQIDGFDPVKIRAINTKLKLWRYQGKKLELKSAVQSDLLSMLIYRVVDAATVTAMKVPTATRREVLAAGAGAAALAFLGLPNLADGQKFTGPIFDELIQGVQKKLTFTGKTKPEVLLSNGKLALRSPPGRVVGIIQAYEAECIKKGTSKDLEQRTRKELMAVMNLTEGQAGQMSFVTFLVEQVAGYMSGFNIASIPRIGIISKSNAAFVTCEFFKIIEVKPIKVKGNEIWSQEDEISSDLVELEDSLLEKTYDSNFIAKSHYGNVFYFPSKAINEVKGFLKFGPEQRAQAGQDVGAFLNDIRMDINRYIGTKLKNIKDDDLKREALASYFAKLKGWYYFTGLDENRVMEQYINFIFHHELKHQVDQKNQGKMMKAENAVDHEVDAYLVQMRTSYLGWVLVLTNAADSFSIQGIKSNNTKACQYIEYTAVQYIQNHQNEFLNEQGNPLFTGLEPFEIMARLWEIDDRLKFRPKDSTVEIPLLQYLTDKIHDEHMKVYGHVPENVQVQRHIPKKTEGHEQSSNTKTLAVVTGITGTVAIPLALYIRGRMKAAAARDMTRQERRRQEAQTAKAASKNKPKKSDRPNKGPDKRANKAMLTNGGIDFNSANLAMVVKRDGRGMPLPLGQQDWAQLSNIEGLDPVILSITPADQTPLPSQLQ